jgi:hypothetical protein
VRPVQGNSFDQRFAARIADLDANQIADGECHVSRNIRGAVRLAVPGGISAALAIRVELMAEIDVRTGMPPRKLHRAAFVRRYLARHRAPAFEPLQDALRAIVDAAWDAYRRQSHS